MAISPIEMAITFAHVGVSLSNKMKLYRDGNQPYRYDNQPYRITYTHVGVSLSNKL